MRIPTLTTPVDALLGLAFSQVTNSFKSSARMSFLAKRTNGFLVSGVIAAKPFTSYGSEYKTPASTWFASNPRSIV
jgi:hypothetical protein